MSCEGLLTQKYGRNSHYAIRTGPDAFLFSTVTFTEVLSVVVYAVLAYGREFNIKLYN